MDTPEGAAALLALVDGGQVNHPDRHVVLVIDPISRTVIGGRTPRTRALSGLPEPDAKGIHRGMGPDIAWFTDPAGNVLSVVSDP